MVCDFLIFGWKGAKIVELFFDHLIYISFFTALQFLSTGEGEVTAVDEADQLEISISFSLIAVIAVGLRRTIAPKDHMSVAVFHGCCMRTSGLVQTGAPTMVPDLAHFDSAGMDTSKSPS